MTNFGGELLQKLQKFQKIYKMGHKWFLLKFIDNLWFFDHGFYNNILFKKMELGSENLIIYNGNF
jgi:hypothetical protein